MESDDFIFTPIIAGLTALSGTTAGAGAGIAAGITSSLVGAGTSIAAATQKQPKVTPTTAIMPDPGMAEEAKAQERRRAGQRQGFKSTILTNALKEYSPQGGKQLIGE